VDRRLEGECVCLRPSQHKFDAASLVLEICDSSFEMVKPGALYLNRPLIKILVSRQSELRRV
jgi:hypothetical protein